MRSILTMSTFLLCASFSSMAQTASDDVQIRGMVQTMEDGWTKKDGTLFAKPFAENADYVVINGMHIKGKTAIAKGHQMIFDTFYKETFIKTEVESIRYVRPDIAIAHILSQMSGMSNGQKAEGKALMTIILEKTAAGWQIVAFQNTHIEAPRVPGN